MASQAWIADRVSGLLRKSSYIGASDLRTKLQDDYNVEIPYPTMWYGRQRALDDLYGKWKDSFHMLWRFKAEIELRAPGSIVEIDTQEIEDNVYFHRFFCALKPCIDGFDKGCRPYLSVDSTALNGQWNGHLASATALDGHNWMFPVAFGFIDAETTENWKWFMEQLQKAIGNPPVLAICSDACKGLENAVSLVFPHAEKRECFRHMMQNFMRLFHGMNFSSLFIAASSYRVDHYESNMEKILAAHPKVREYLEKHHNLLWMRCHFSPLIKCDHINNNLAEAFNSWVRDIKDLPIVELADRIREMIMKLFVKRRRIGERLQGHILPAVIEQLNKKTRGLGNIRVSLNAYPSAEVTEIDRKHTVHRHVVDLERHQCTCGEWQLCGKPCLHALTFIISLKNPNMEKYVDEYFSLAKFKAAYAGLISPITDKSQWPQIDVGFKMLPPLGKRSSGRPRKKRIPSFLEKANSTKGKNRCKKCGELGHRQAGCPTNGTKKRKRKQRNNSSTGQRAAPSPTNVTTPTKRMATTPQHSPGPVTRRQLALSLAGEASTQGPSSPALRTRSHGPAIDVPPPKTKKMTPRKKKK